MTVTASVDTVLQTKNIDQRHAGDQRAIPASADRPASSESDAR